METRTIALERTAPRDDLHFFAHRRQQALDCFHCRRELTTLQPADRRLGRAGPDRQLALRQPICHSAVTDESSNVHRWKYTGCGMPGGLVTARPLPYHT